MIPTVDIAIIGAGIGGLTFAVELRKKLPHASFIILEKASDVGGTWRDNVYPGCSSDTRIHLYSLSAEQKPDWAKTHGSSAHILAYWKSIAEKHELYPHIIFNTLVIGAEWVISEQHWSIRREDVETREETSVKARVLISAIGSLERPSVPRLPGLETFGGEWWHSARWRTDVDLRGKKVAVIGNGASAAQFIPEITKDETIQVTQFCRSPTWFWKTRSTTHSPVSERQKWIFKHIPGALTSYRWYYFLMSEVFWVMFSYFKKPTANLIASYIKDTAPAKYHDILIPAFPVACKRTVFDNGYIDSLRRPNLTLSTEPIVNITRHGVYTRNGEETSVDVIIMATGFISHTYPIEIKGVEGKTIQDYYDSCGGPQAYKATGLPGFPNFFMILGPNVATGHSSALFAAEVQTKYLIQVLRPLFPPPPKPNSRHIHRRSSSNDPLVSLSTKITSLAPSHESTNEYNEYLQSWLNNSIWTSCSSWYRQGSSGKIVSVYPGPMILFWWQLYSPRWSHWEGWNKYGERVDSDGVRAWIQELHGLERWKVWKFIFQAVGWSLATVAGWLCTAWVAGAF